MCKLPGGGHIEALPPGGQPAPHPVAVQHPLFPYNTASEAQDLAVLGSVGKGTAGECNIGMSDVI